MYQTFKLSDSQKGVLIDGVLNEKLAIPAQIEQQIDEFKQSAVKLQQGQDYFALLETQSLKLQHRIADIVRQVQSHRTQECCRVLELPLSLTGACHLEAFQPLHGEFNFSGERMVNSMGLAVPKNPGWKSD